SPASTPSAQTSASLSEVVVTANRVDVPVQDVTSSSTVITAQDMEQKQAGTVKDALQGVPGLDITQNGNPGETSPVYIRGADPELTLILMDGIPLNDPSGSPSDYEYLDGLSLDDVKQVEVIRGPQSTLWGSNAIGGVINIIPQSGPAPLGGSVLMEGGSYGTSREAVSAQGGDNGGYFNLNASHYNTAGFPALNVKGLDASDAALEGPNPGSINNGDDNNTASLRLGSNLATNLEEKFFARYSQSNTGFDEYNGNGVLADDPLAFALQKQFMADSHTDWKLLDGSWDQELTVAFFDDNRLYNATANPYSTFVDQGNYDSQTAQVLWQNNVHFAKEETLVLGIQGQDQSAVAADNSSYGPSALPVTHVTAGSGFAESQTSIDERLFFNLGGRWEDQSQYGVHTTYQAGLAYSIPGLETKLKVNYGTGFLAPSLYQLFNPAPFALGNPNLKPETSLGYDLGFEQPIGGKDILNIGADYFDNDLTNLIQYQNSTYANIGQVRTYGVESFLEFKGITNLNIKGSYTYTYAWDQTDNVPLLRRPQNKASGNVDYQWDALGVGTSLIYTGTSLDDDFYGNPVTLPSYFLVNLRASYQISPQVKVFARVDNLFNQWYETDYGYSTAGLSAYGGTKVSF
ncbi:MAG TPA: TonB-dependent receptor, partial [bacterium]|nr:TonB-dependent receptor [bacterium]